MIKKKKEHDLFTAAFTTAMHDLSNTNGTLYFIIATEVALYTAVARYIKCKRRAMRSEASYIIRFF